MTRRRAPSVPDAPDGRPERATPRAAVSAFLPAEGLRLAYADFFDRPATLGFGIACVPAAALALLALPALAGRILDAARGADPAPIGALCAAFAALALVEALLRYAGRRILVDASRRMEERLKQRIVRHLGRLPIGWFDAAATGDVLSRMTQDVELVRFVTGPALLYLGQAAVVVPGGLALLAAGSPLVATAAAAVFVLLGLALWRLGPRLRDESAAAQEAIGRIAQRASEAFSGIRILRLFGRAPAEAHAMRALGDAYRERNVAVARSLALVNLAIHVALELVVLVGLALGALEVAAGNLTLGGLLELWALLGIALGPLLAVGFLVAAAPKAAAAAARIRELLDVPVAPGGGRPIRSAATLRVERLRFRYAGARRDALCDVTLEIRRGQTIGIVGPVGAGKSTLLAVLLRLYDPPRGTVFVGPDDVLDLDPSALRRRFALAPQDPFLFSGTLRDNVAFDAPDADPERVLRALHTAGFGPDLATLPDGIETPIGERGVTLSGGQRQRVSLARALCSERPILVLDDALSAVDHATERRIAAALRAERAERTMIVATHRLAMVADADRVLVLDGGRPRAAGTHAELLARDLHYAASWRRQVERDALEGLAEGGL